MFWQGCIELVLKLDRKFTMKNLRKVFTAKSVIQEGGLLLIYGQQCINLYMYIKSIWLYIYLNREHLPLTIENVWSAINSYRLQMAAGIKKNEIDFRVPIFSFSGFLNETHSLIKSRFWISPTMPMVFNVCQSFLTRRCLLLCYWLE